MMPTISSADTDNSAPSTVMAPATMRVDFIIDKGPARGGEIVTQQMEPAVFGLFQNLPEHAFIDLDDNVLEFEGAVLVMESQTAAGTGEIANDTARDVGRDIPATSFGVRGLIHVKRTNLASRAAIDARRGKSEDTVHDRLEAGARNA